MMPDPTTAAPDDVQIVLVEDNENDAELFFRVIADCHDARRVFWAKDGQQALDYLLSREGSGARHVLTVPRVVFLDLKLPKVAGFEVLSLLRADPKTENIPVVIVSSSKEPIDVLRAYRLGANSYVVKPIDFENYIKKD